METNTLKSDPSAFSSAAACASVFLRKGEPPPWPALKMSTPVYDAGLVVGTLEVQYSIHHILRNTAFAALFGLVLAGGIFFVLRVLPLRALERTTGALKQEIAQHERARATAEAANRSKSQFLAAASHDLRQPMHSLGLFAASLSERVTDPAVRGIADNISASVEALESLFNELLDISRLDAGVIKPNLASFALEPLFERMRIDFAPAAQEKGVAVLAEDAVNVALRGGASYVNNADDQRVPFYVFPYIGGADTVRGYREFRFRDENVVFFNGEYRWDALKHLEVAPFFDMGKVASDWQDVNLSDMRTAVGLGLRLHADSRVFFRIDVGMGGGEGRNYFLKFGPSF